MPRYSFQVRDDEGFAINHDEPRIEYEVVNDGGTPRIEVTEIWCDRELLKGGVLLRPAPVNLLDPHIAERDFLKRLGIEIKHAIESDEDWCWSRLQEAGFASRGSWNDPNAHVYATEEA